MLLFKRNYIEKIVLHLENPITIEDSIYVIEYINDITNEVVYTEPTDISNYKERYNEFLIDVDEYFENKENGFWTYNVYEYKADPLFKRLIQCGKMKLVGDAFDFTEYDNQDNEFIVYNN